MGIPEFLPEWVEMFLIFIVCKIRPTEYYTVRHKQSGFYTYSAGGVLRILSPMWLGGT